MRTLEKLTIKNFKSIREQTLALGKLNIFIGGNGAGKSNLIQAFRLLREISQQNLASYSLARGVEGLLHFGRKQSRFMELYVEFGEGGLSNAYRVNLAPSDEGTLVVGQETVYFHDRAKWPTPTNEVINSGSKESVLGTIKTGIASYVKRDLDTYRVYHFHDTSDTAAVKDACEVEDNRALRSQAENLAAFLYWMQQKHPDHFANVQDTVRQIAPFFEEFRLAPSKLTESKIRLEWKEKGSDAYFNASSLSDGTLRFLCLTTLLLQPQLPAVVLLDEPELGLHPAAVTLLADLISSASTRTQVIVATQSVTLVNQFEQDAVWTVDRKDNQSVFTHLILIRFQDETKHGRVSAWQDHVGWIHSS